MEGVDDVLQKKYSQLTLKISQMKRVVVAYSGGTDSSLLLKAALDSLATSDVLAVTVRSPLTHEKDIAFAVETASALGIRHKILQADLLDVAEVAANTPKRCFYCKRQIFLMLTALAHEEGCSFVIEGTNASDLEDLRPGIAALKSFETVRSPLAECGLTKEDIRMIARLLGLRNWNRPASPCLATRIPFGEPLTKEKLEKVSHAEDSLSELGFSNFRVRYHGNLARIEIAQNEFPKALQLELLKLISQKVKSCGFTYVTLDLDGYRTGSFHEALNKNL